MTPARWEPLDPTEDLSGWEPPDPWEDLPYVVVRLVCCGERPLAQLTAPLRTPDRVSWVHKEWHGVQAGAATDEPGGKVRIRCASCRGSYLVGAGHPVWQATERLAHAVCWGEVGGNLWWWLLRRNKLTRYAVRQ